MAPSRVAVVGAGLAGLAAAIGLKRRGHAVELFERSRLVGGKATSFEVDGIEVDNGQHVFLACCDQFIDFLRQLDLSMGSDSRADPVYLQQRFEALMVTADGRHIRMTAANLPAPFHLLPALAASGQLGWPGRLQVALGVRALGKPARPGESFRAWLDRHLQGQRARVGFWEPFLVPALNAELDAVSADDAGFVIRTAFLANADAARFGYSVIPLGQVAQRAVESLDAVHLRRAVTAVNVNQETTARPAIQHGDKTEQFDGLVLALPPDRLKNLLRCPKEFGVYGLDQFGYAPIVDIHLWFDMPPGTVFDRIDFAALLDSPIQWIFEKPAPPGETYLCCSMSAAHEQVGQARETLIETAASELKRRFPVLRQAKLLRGAATRDREATFVPSIGLVRPGNATRFPRVTIAGAWTDTGWPATMESAVRSGRKAAEVLHGAIAA